MRTRSAIAVVLCFFLFAPFLFAADQVAVDTELLAYVQRQSEVWYNSYTAQHGVVEPGDWQEPVESAFLKLANSSGRPGFEINYAVLKDKDFNAASFPGGQFIINVGTLETLDRIIESQAGTPLSRIAPAELKQRRENILAPILAHELGHYYSRHTYAAMKKKWAMEDLQKPNIDLTMIAFSQDNELEADKVGSLLLAQAGYDPGLMLSTLELLNDIQQGQMKEAPDADFNTYFSSHPSPHRRLAAFQGDKQALHAWAAEMEDAFSDVQIGRNLPQAVAVIDKGLTVVPSNLYLMNERAVALHKQWLQTVALKDQKLRAIVDSPSFRDEMVFSKRGTRGAEKVIPGDKALYLKARAAYLAIYDTSEDPTLYSNFALLLAYSPDANDEKAAATLAKMATDAASTYSNASNLATVLYLVNRKDDAFGLLAGIASDLDTRYTKLFAEEAKDPAVAETLQSLRDRMKQTQALNESFVADDFTPLLNLALCLAYAGRQDTAQQLASDYLARYESTSSWAQYLAATSGAPIPKQAARAPLPVKDIAVGSSLAQVVQKWGKATEVTTMDNGDELWSYDPLKAQVGVKDGSVYSIELDAIESPKIDNRFGVGSTQAEIEKALGASKRVANHYFIYEGGQSLGVLYAKEVAQQIILFP
jgi:Zn-dependent protease with chaperone function